MPFDIQGGRVDVDFVANTGQFHRANAEVRAEYGRTTAVMSDESIRAALAQEKLDRAIAQAGPTSARAKAATLSYRNEMRALQVQATRTAEAEAVANRERRSARRSSTPGTLAYSRSAQAVEAALLAGGARAGRGRTGRGHSSLADEERSLGRFGRGALAGTGLMHGLGRAVSFASTAFLGGAGLVFAIHKTIEASREEEVALALVRQALHANGLSWKEYGGNIEEATKRLEDHTAFNRVELNGVLASLIRRTGDVNQAIDLTGKAADLARGKNIDLATAGGVLIKAVNGQTGALRRMGLNIVTVTAAQDKLHASGQKATAAQIAQAKAADKAATIEGILAGVRQKYGGAAARYLRTEAGQQALLNARLHDSEVIIGNALKPAITKLVGSLAAWLDKMNRTGKLQRDVNQAVRVGTAAAHGLAGGFRVIRGIVTPLNHALGGTRHTVELLALAFVGLKLAKVATQIRVMAAAWRGVRTAALGAAEAEALASRGGLGGLLGRGGGLGKVAAGGLLGLGAATTSVALFDVVAIMASHGAQGYSKRGQRGAAAGSGASQAAKDAFPILHRILGDQDFPDDVEPAKRQQALNILDRYLRGYLGAAAAESQLQKLNPYGSGAGLGGGVGGAGGDFAPRFGRGDRGNARRAQRRANRERKNSDRGGRPGDGSAGPPKVGSSYQTQLAISQAQLTPDQKDDLAAYRRAEAELRGELKQKGLTRQDRLSITDELGGVLGQERSITDAQRQKHQDRVKKSRDAREKKAKEQAAAAKKNRDAEVKRLTSVPIDLRIAEQSALAHHAGEAKLLAIYKRELASIEHQIQIIKKQHLGKQAVLAAKHAAADVQRKIDKLTGKAGGGSGQSFFGEAVNEFDRYGSNIGGPNAPLSGQDARALLAVIAKSMGDVAEHTKKTAHHTKTIVKQTPSEIAHARLAAMSGY